MYKVRGGRGRGQHSKHQKEFLEMEKLIQEHT